VLGGQDTADAGAADLPELLLLLLLLLLLSHFPQPRKKVEKKYANKGAEFDDTPLDDPIAERLRKQRLEEEADMRCVFCVGTQGKSKHGMASHTHEQRVRVCVLLIRC
jgi:hypothetical protein